MQIRAKLTLTYFIISFILLISSLLFIYYSFRNYIYTEFYDTLRSKALMTVMMVEKSNPDLTFENDNQSSETSLSETENIIIYDLSFKKLFSINNKLNIENYILDNIVNKKELKFSLGNVNAIGIKHNTSIGKDIIIVATDKFMSEELASLRNIMIYTSFLFLLIIAVSGYYFSGQALAPINTTIRNLKEIFPNDLSRRLNINQKNKDEISRLNMTFNELLDRIEDSFNTQKGFLSNISHEIRNPLASIISTIQVKLTKEGTEDEYRQCLNSVLDDAREMEHTTLQLMELARLTDTGSKISFSSLRLDEMIWQAKASVRKNNPEYNFKFDTTAFPEDSDALIINGNETLIKIALYNLLENACKFSPDHTASVKVFIDGSNKIFIQIKDTAHIIDDHEKESIFKPFYRRKISTNVKGTGIGLTLVAGILKVHHAALEITNNDNSGNLFTLCFSGKDISN
jgi:signal transduction histidine kinase